MISRLDIKGLLGLYNYSLNFGNEDGSLIKIITGPNGYGKTSVLRLINSLFMRDYETMFSIPFESASFHIDGRRIDVRQERTTEQEDCSDVPLLKTEKLHLRFIDDEDNIQSSIEDYEIERLAGQVDRYSINSFNLFMNSRTCFHISDDRLLSRKSDIKEEQIDMGSERLKMDADAFKRKLVENNYTDGKEELLPEVFRRQLSLFRKVISDSHFADKKMVINRSNGLRFKSIGGLGEYISLASLSSGEKHILIQTLELIFLAEEGMLAMVDEPELSFHPAWLNQYLGILEQIQQLKSSGSHPFQMIIATHSPELIGRHWDWSIDLYENRIR